MKYKLCTHNFKVISSKQLLVKLQIYTFIVFYIVLYSSCIPRILNKVYQNDAKKMLYIKWI